MLTQNLLSTGELGTDLQAPSVHLREGSNFSGKMVINLLFLSVPSEEYNCEYSMTEDKTKLQLIGILNSSASF